MDLAQLSEGEDQMNLSKQEKQRVRRACESCRRKKIKCDGDDPCGRCKNHGASCRYVEWQPVCGGDSAQMRNLEDRVCEMEKSLSRFTTNLDSTVSVAVKQSLQESLTKLNFFNSSGEFDTAGDELSKNATATNTSHLLGLWPSLECTTALEPAVKRTYSRSGLQALPVTAASHPQGRWYGNGFCELNPDLSGHLRYVGFGSTATIVDRCVGLRNHIHENLQKKGYESGEPYLTLLRGATNDQVFDTLKRKISSSMPTKQELQMLMKTYFENLAFLLPIVTESEVVSMYHHLSSDVNPDLGKAAMFFSILSASSCAMHNFTPRDHNHKSYVDGQRGKPYYDLAMELASLSSRISKSIDLLDFVNAKALLTVCLIRCGSHADAWILVGDAIRRGQDIGLHRSPKTLNMPANESLRRTLTWWSLYVLEVQLNTALGRPTSIDDDDCDVEMPSQYSGSNDFSDLISTIALHQILKGILRTVNSIKNTSNWQDNTKRSNLEARVRGHHAALTAWSNVNENPNSTSEHSRTVAVINRSFFFVANLLLYRILMPHPHRPSAPSCPFAQTICAKNAVQCIQEAGGLHVQTPVLYLTFLEQSLFVSTTVLLQCIRNSNDKEFDSQALKYVERAVQQLHKMETTCESGGKHCATIQEYIHLTRLMLQGVYTKGACNFPSCAHELQTSLYTMFDALKPPRTNNSNPSPFDKSKRCKLMVSSDSRGEPTIDVSTPCQTSGTEDLIGNTDGVQYSNHTSTLQPLECLLQSNNLAKVRSTSWCIVPESVPKCGADTVNPPLEMPTPDNKDLEFFWPDDNQNYEQYLNW